MPRIRDQFSDVAVYIYTSLEDAQDGRAYGGSGFLVDIPFGTNAALHYLYVVTNRHVIKKSPEPVIRINRKDGTVECTPTQQDEWVFHRDGDDVAVFHLVTEVEEWQKLQIATVGINQFVTPQTIEDEDIGIGDDTIMVGRFINHEGKQQNTPSVRFGNIAMMPKEKIASSAGFAQESFLVEIRSLPGYSGSAVLIYSPCAMNDMSERRFGKPKSFPGSFPGFVRATEKDIIRNLAAKGPYLLGIDWCHLHQTVPVTDKDGQPLRYGWMVSENSGMAGVIPAWKISEVLNCEVLMDDRRKEAERIEAQLKTSGISLDFAENPPKFTKEEFIAALKKATRKTS